MISHIGTSITNEPYPDHTHVCYEITYVHEGVGYMKVGDNQLPFKPGTIFIVPPRTVHSLFSFNGHIATSMLSRSEMLLPVKDIRSIEDNEHKEGYALVEIMVRHNASFDEYLQKLAEAFIIFLVKSLDLTKINEQRNKAVDRIIERMNKGFSDFDLDVKKILRESGYAENYIREIFKEVTGVTPTQYLTDIRIEHAKTMFLVCKKDHPISDIAQKSGFVDISYFSKTFKKYCRCTPSEFQKENGRGQDYEEKIKEQNGVVVYPLQN